jgi:hypothetical protein
MNPALRSSIFIAGVLANLAVPSWAFWAEPVDIETCVRDADLIFAGTVSDLTYEKTSETIITHVRFRELVVVKGDVNDSTLTLTVHGGRFENRIVEEVGFPTYDLSRRYVLLVKRDRGSRQNLYSPIVYFDQGYFVARPADFEGRSEFADSHGRALLDLREGHLVVLAPKRRRGAEQVAPDSLREKAHAPGAFFWNGKLALEVIPQVADPGTRLSERELLEKLRRLNAKR